jgi:hypothetical protein
MPFKVESETFTCALCAKRILTADRCPVWIAKTSRDFFTLFGGANANAELALNPVSNRSSKAVAFPKITSLAAGHIRLTFFCPAHNAYFVIFAINANWEAGAGP